MNKSYSKYKEDISVETVNDKSLGSFDMLSVNLFKSDFEEMPWFKDDAKILAKMVRLAEQLNKVYF